MDTFAKIAKPEHGNAREWKCRFCGYVGPGSAFVKRKRAGRNGWVVTTCCIECSAKGLTGRAKPEWARSVVKSVDYSIDSIPTHVGKASRVSDWCESTLLGFTEIR